MNASAFNSVNSSSSLLVSSTSATSTSVQHDESVEMKCPSRAISSTARSMRKRSSRTSPAARICSITTTCESPVTLAHTAATLLSSAARSDSSCIGRATSNSSHVSASNGLACTESAPRTASAARDESRDSRPSRVSTSSEPRMVIGGNAGIGDQFHPWVGLRALIAVVPSSDARGSIPTPLLIRDP